MVRVQLPAAAPILYRLRVSTRPSLQNSAHSGQHGGSLPFSWGSWQTSNALALQASLCGSVTHRLHHPSLGTQARRGFQAKDVLHRLGEGGLSTNRVPSYGWQAMFYTYVIERLSQVNQRYTRHTADLRQRLADHNAGKCPHTSKFVPWKIKLYVAF